MLAFLLLPALQKLRFKIGGQGFRIIAKVKNALGKELKKKNSDTFFTIGFLNGLLPCGLVYMSVLGAIATGNAAEGAVYMALFGLGTIPLMTAAIWIGNFLSLKIKNNIRKLVPVFLGLIAILFILRGLGLGIPYISPKMETEKVQAFQNCH